MLDALWKQIQPGAAACPKMTRDELLELGGGQALSQDATIGRVTGAKRSWLRGVLTDARTFELDLCLGRPVTD